MATTTATAISEAIIPTPVAKVLKWTTQTVSPSAAAAVARVAKTVVKANPVEKETRLIESEAAAGQLELGQRELKGTDESEPDKTKRADMDTDKKAGAKTGADTIPSVMKGVGGGKGVINTNSTPKRGKVQIKTEITVELEVGLEEATMTQVGAVIQFQSRWEGFTLRQVVKDMVKRSTRCVGRTTWFYVGRALRYAASYV